MNDYQVLYRKDAEFAHLVILYKDQHGNSISSPSILYAFRKESGSAIMRKDHAPTRVKNVHGNNLYQNYLDRGWRDITASEDSYPWAIKSWLANKMYKLKN